MKKFALNLFIFLIPLSIIYYVKPLLLIQSGAYKLSVTGREIYFSIAKSKQKTKKRKVIIGDSVGKQLFTNDYDVDNLYSLTCNQAIGLSGHYFLLNNYFSAGNEADTVYLLFIPLSFKNNLDQVYTYQYFLKPFYNSEYKPLFTKTVFEQIKKIPYYFLSWEPHILTSNWAPSFSPKDPEDDLFISKISVEYLQLMKELCEQNNTSLILVSPPLMESEKEKIESVDHEQFKTIGLQSEFENYFNNFIFLNDTNFMDGIHMKRPEEIRTYYLEHLIR